MLCGNIWSVMIDQILPIFFAAMQDGYANDGNVRKSTIAKFHGSKMILFNQGDFKVQDTYLVVPDSSYSSGQTVILYKNDPVWSMSYQGWYDDAAIPFLKMALREAYCRQDFFGGRGPHFFAANGMAYINNVEPPNDWWRFRGREEILAPDGQNIGWHEYQGLLLVKR